MRQTVHRTVELVRNGIRPAFLFRKRAGFHEASMAPNQP